MKDDKKVKDLMINIFDYPHVPYWFTINQAIKIIKVSFMGKKERPEPMAILVFDEKYNLLGTLTLRDILKGLEPKFLHPEIKAQVSEEDESGLALIWDSLFDAKTKELAERPVSEVMVTAKHFVEPDDSVAKAAYLMIHHDMDILPVLENKKKFVGLVRMGEVFDELSKAIVKE